MHNMADNGIYALMGVLGGSCMIMSLIMRNTPPTGLQWLAIMFLSANGGYLSFVLIESYGKYHEWELVAAFFAGFSATQLGKMFLQVLEDPKRVLSIIKWIRGKQ